MEDRLLTARQTWTMLSVSKTKLYEMIKLGYITPVDISTPGSKVRRIRFKLSEVQVLINRLPKV